MYVYQCPPRGDTGDTVTGKGGSHTSQQAAALLLSGGTGHRQGTHWNWHAGHTGIRSLRAWGRDGQGGVLPQSMGPVSDRIAGGAHVVCAGRREPLGDWGIRKSHQELVKETLEH